MKNLNKNDESLEEVNLLFEMIKTVLLTRLSITKIKQLLKEYTHSEIRNGVYQDGVFIAPDLVNLD